MNMTFSIADLVDSVIVLTAFEALALVAYDQLSGRGVAPRDFLANLTSGVFLMLALHCAVRDVGAPWIAACLSGAGLAHGTDLVMRWRRRQRRTDTFRSATP